MTLTKPGAKKQRLANDCGGGPATASVPADAYKCAQQSNSASTSGSGAPTSASTHVSGDAPATAQLATAAGPGAAAAAAMASACAAEMASSGAFSSDQVDCICEVLIRGNSHEKLSQFLDSLPPALRSRSSESLLKARVLMAFVQVWACLLAFVC